MGLFMDLAVLWGSWQLLLSGSGYFSHFYKHYFLKHVFGIEPKEEEKKPNAGHTHSHGGQQNQCVENNCDGEDQRVEFVKMQKYSPWHDVDPTCENENYINCVIEITVGSKRKFEVATKEDFNSIKPDMKDGKIRKLEYRGDGDPNNIFNFNGMPHAYGMIPRTFEDPTHKEVVAVSVIGESKSEKIELGGDEDPLDIFVLSERKIPMGQVRCKVIGVIHFVDGGEIDYKIIAVDADFNDI